MHNLPDIAFFHTLAAAAAEQTLPRSTQNLHIGNKPKEGFRFNPVTDADREAERAIRALISTHYPEHAILGEEFGAVGDGETQWILDPGDGIRPFLCGIPVWGTLMGLLHRGRAQRAPPSTGSTISFRVMVNGTANKMPINPNNPCHTSSEIKTTLVAIFSFRPHRYGSTIQPNIRLMNRNAASAAIPVLIPLKANT